MDKGSLQSNPSQIIQKEIFILQKRPFEGDHADGPLPKRNKPNPPEDCQDGPGNNDQLPYMPPEPTNDMLELMNKPSSYWLKILHEQSGIYDERAI